MQAVSALAPVLGPLAIKFIDNYIFDERKERRSRSRAIGSTAPPQFICCCGQLSDRYDSETQTCSTCCTTESSRYRPSKLSLPTASTGRSSSTSDAYENEMIQPSHPRRARICSDSETKSTKYSSYSHHHRHQQSTYASNNNDTLAVLASQLKRRISPRSSGQPKVSPHCRPSIMLGSTENTNEKSSRMKIANKCATSSTVTRKSCGKSIVESKHDGPNSKKYTSESIAMKIVKR